MTTTVSGGLQFAGVSKSFVTRHGNVTALAEFSLEVDAGDFVAILGPSGCGKSTALRLAAGLEKPDGGDLTIGGAAPADLVASRQLGVAFQDNALLPWLSVRKNVELPFN